MARIIIRPEAQSDIDQIVNFIEDQSSEARAASWFNRLNRNLDTLSEQPRMGRKRDELRPGLRSHSIGSYVIFYYPLDDGIDVVRLLYGGRDLDAIFNEDGDS